MRPRLVLVRNERLVLPRQGVWIGRLRSLAIHVACYGSAVVLGWLVARGCA